MSKGGHEYLPALDGIRALSILLVLVSHAWLGHIVPGGLGVTIFFFISGFIITRLMLKEWDERGTVSIKGFYLRRFVRITPALTVYVVVSSIAVLVAGSGLRWTEVAAVFLYAANYYDIFVGFGPGLQPFSITWSLAVEEHYYFVYPVLFLALAAHPRRFIGVIVALLLAVLAWRLYLAAGVGMAGLAHDRIYKGTDTRVDSILYGALFSILMHHAPAWRTFFARRSVFLASAALLLATLVLRNEIFRESLRYSLQGLAIGGLLYTAVFGHGVVQRWLACAPLVYIGKISYSLYLYHWLALGIVNTFLPEQSFAVRVMVLVVLAFAASHLSYTWVERPALRQRGRLAAWLRI